MLLDGSSVQGVFSLVQGGIEIPSVLLFNGIHSHLHRQLPVFLFAHASRTLFMKARSDDDFLFVLYSLPIWHPFRHTCLKGPLHGLHCRYSVKTNEVFIMNKLEQIKNEALNMGTNARKALLVELLRAEENRQLNSMIPLDADHEQVRRDQKNDRTATIVAITAGAVAALAGSVLLLAKGQKKLKIEAEHAKEQLEQEKKEMIRKMTMVKGRH